MSVKVAVVGVGALGQHHARILANLQDVELVYVVDVNEERAKEIASKYKTNYLLCYKKLNDIDGVVVAVPTTMHKEVTNHFLSRGISVLCEKPLSSDLNECDEMIDCAVKNGAKLLVGHIEHFNPVLKPIFEERLTPGFVEAHRLGVFTGRSLDVDVVYDLMVHDIEIVEEILKSKIISIDAVGINVLSNKIDICNARLRYECGCIVNLTASRISREKVRKLRIFEERRYFSIDYAEQNVECYAVKSENGKNIIEKVGIEVEKDEPLKRELIHFIDVIKGKVEPLVDGEKARKAVLIASFILESIRRRCQLTL